ncbi:hypothetical protein HDK64DRAFT_19726 [Phyllosticta capitalensis]
MRVEFAICCCLASWLVVARRRLPAVVPRETRFSRVNPLRKSNNKRIKTPSLLSGVQRRDRPHRPVSRGRCPAHPAFSQLSAAPNE